MFFSILIILLIFLIIGFTGYTILRSIIEEQNFFISISASIFLGLSVYIFLLNINSKVFHGPSGIISSTLETMLLCCYLFLKYRKGWADIKLGGNSLNWFFLFCLVILITIKTTTVFPAADSTMQWAYAGSFERGNYPLMMPWQPDLPPNYHLGAYFFEGALQFFSGLSFVPIHSLVNIFFIVPDILLSIFLLWNKKYSFKNFWLVIASLVLFISFGVIILSYPTLTNHQKTIISLRDLDKLTAYITAKGEGGAPLVNLNILTLLPARSVGLGLILLSLYFTRAAFKNNKLKILSYTLIFSVTALVEESMFLPMLLAAFSILILSIFSFIPNLNLLKYQRKTLFLITILTTIVITLQGGFISDNLFTRKESVYHLIIPFLDPLFLANASILNNLNITSISPFEYINLLVPSPIWIIIALILYSLIKREWTIGLIGIFSAISFLLSISVEYIYCPACSARIYSLANMTTGYGLILLIFSALNKLSIKKNLLFFLILSPILIMPTILPDLVKQVKSVREGLRDNKPSVIFSSIADNQGFITKWANKNLPLNTRVIVLDNEFPSPGGSLNFQYEGVYTIFSPQYIRSNRQEPGIEFFDLALTLNPSLLKQTKTDYIYIDSESEAYKQLPQFRKNDLANNKYFQILISVDANSQNNPRFSRIYKVLPAFLDPKVGGEEINDVTLSKLEDLLPNNQSVYISDYGIQKLSFWYRMALVLALKNKDIRRDLSQTEYQVLEEFLPRKNSNPNEVYDYYLLSSIEKPSFPAQLIWSNIFAAAWKRI